MSHLNEVRMSVSGTDSQIKTNTQHNLDETLPSTCGKRYLPQEVYSLQYEYERRLQEEEETNNDEVNKCQSTVHKKDEGRRRSRKGSTNSCTRTREQKPREEITKTVSSMKRSSNDGHKALFDTEETFLISANNEGHSDEKRVVRKEQKVLSLSLPSSGIKSEKGKTTAKDGNKVRRSSDSIQEVSKRKDGYKCIEENARTLTLETKERRNRNREKRENKKDDCAKPSSSDLDKTSQTALEMSHKMKHGDTAKSPINEHTVHTALQSEDVGIPLAGGTKESRTMLEAKTVNKYEITQGEKLTNTSRSAKTFHKSQKSPSMLPSQNVLQERISSDKVTHDNAVASETYVSECSKCNSRKKYAPATSYCLNCGYYLCQNCLNIHNKLMDYHKILKGNEMPGSFTIKQISEKCAKHSNENITCFCEEHNCLCCVECNKGDHANCTKQPLESMLIQIPDVLKLRQNISKSCNHKLISLRKLHKELKSDKDTESNAKDKAIEEIKNKSSVMIDHIKKLEKDSIKHVCEYFSEVNIRKEKLIGECEQNIEIMCENIRYLDEPKGKKESAIRTVERMKQIEIQSLSKEAGDTENIVSAKACQFVVNENLYKTVTEAACLGELSDKVPVDWNKTNSSMGQSLLSDADKTLETSKLIDTENSSCICEEDLDNLLVSKSVGDLQRISIWTAGDLRSHTCCTAIEVLEDGTVLVSDRDNRKLKWFDSTFSLKKAITLSSEPWGITKIFTNKYLVTLPMESSYQELDVFEEDITLRDKIVLDIECTCAVQLNDKLLFAGIDDDKPKFLLTKLDGTIIEFIFTEKKFDLFRRPNHLQKSLLHPDLIFVSDVDKGVFGIDVVQKKIVFHYTPQSLMCSMGMTSTESGLLYICSQQTNTLHCISHEGQFLYAVSLQDVRALITPQCICYIRELDEFLIVHDNSYNIFRFKLK